MGAFSTKESRLNIRVNKELKEAAGSICQGMGLTLSSVVNACLQQVVSQKAIPFPIELNPRGLSAEAFEAEQKAQAAVKMAIEETFANGNPIACYDFELNKPYFKYPDGRIDYNVD